MKSETLGYYKSSNISPWYVCSHYLMNHKVILLLALLFRHLKDKNKAQIQISWALILNTKKSL